MFSHPLDPPSVREARAFEERYIAKWVAQARERSSASGGGMQMSGGGGAPAAVHGASVAEE